MVAKRTTREFVSLARQAAGLIVMEGGGRSHAAQMAMELGIVAIIGAGEAWSTLDDKQAVTLDPANGVVYEGWVSK